MKLELVMSLVFSKNVSELYMINNLLEIWLSGNFLSLIALDITSPENSYLQLSYNHEQDSSR